MIHLAIGLPMPTSRAPLRLRPMLAVSEPAGLTAGVIDLDSEKARLEKEIAKMDAEVERFEGKLANEKFIANAPEAVVETEREKLKDAINQRAKIDEALGRLTAAS